MNEVYLKSDNEITPSQVDFYSECPFRVITKGHIFDSFCSKNEQGFEIFPYTEEYFKALQILNPSIEIPRYKYTSTQLIDFLFNHYENNLRAHKNGDKIVVGDDEICFIEIVDNNGYKFAIDGKFFEPQDAKTYIDGLILEKSKTKSL